MLVIFLVSAAYAGIVISTNMNMRKIKNTNLIFLILKSFLKFKFWAQKKHNIIGCSNSADWLCYAGKRFCNRYSITSDELCKFLPDWIAYQRSNDNLSLTILKSRRSFSLSSFLIMDVMVVRLRPLMAVRSSIDSPWRCSLIIASRFFFVICMVTTPFILGQQMHCSWIYYQNYFLQ